MGAVNFAEVVTKLREKGFMTNEAVEVLDGHHLDVCPLTASQAANAGHLRLATRALGLSLGDRACLALAAGLGVVALTADREWTKADVYVTIEVVQ